MEPKSKYEEALERAKQGLPINEIFPELKESEDERIRKALIHLINEQDGFLTAINGISVKDIIAYLEKQKEQKPSVCDGEIEDKKRDIVAAIRKYYPADYAEYLTSFLKGLSPEDNSEDEYGQEMLSIAYKLMYGHIPENLRTKEFWDSLKFMREYTGRVAIIHSYEKPAEWSEEDEKHLYNAIEAVKYTYDVSADSSGAQCIEFLKSLPERFNLQPKQEWSDEDKKILYEIIRNINAYDAYTGTSYQRLELHDKKINFLKSLRPQPHWKPSKDQMKILRKYVMGEWRDLTIGQDKILTSLYIDLEKL